MLFQKVLIANRGEIALRIQRALTSLGILSVAVFAEDDRDSKHVLCADEAFPLDGMGASAYLNVAQIIQIAKQSGVDAIHPGYGFLSERADFAQACADAGIVFIGPLPNHLEQLGDKSQALELARKLSIPVMPSTSSDASYAEVEQFFDAHQKTGIVLKAVAGGGGRGMRLVSNKSELAEAYERCQSEARGAFGVASIYAEKLVRRARHVEIQVLGDGHEVLALGDRDCTLQRRFQKLVELAPSPILTPELRLAMNQDAVKLTQSLDYIGLGTVEFLVDMDEHNRPVAYYFIETNPRLQVEHTITEEVTGLDLVALQIKVAQGLCLKDLISHRPVESKGMAMQLRINAEVALPNGMTKPSSGQITQFDPPSGKGMRLDSHAYVAYKPSGHYDTLLAKLIVHQPSDDFSVLLRQAQRALHEFAIEGIATNLDLLRTVLDTPEFTDQTIHTRYLDESIENLLTRSHVKNAKNFDARPSIGGGSIHLTHASVLDNERFSEGHEVVRAIMTGRVVSVSVSVGQVVAAGESLLILDAMKMEHSVEALQSAKVIELRVKADEYVTEDQVLVVLEVLDQQVSTQQDESNTDFTVIRPDLQKLLNRLSFLYDEARPEVVAKRHARGQKTARENIAQLCDEGTFKEYGGLAVAAQASRRTHEDLVKNTPADGMITGLAKVNGHLFDATRSSCAVLAYDATVLAGTQGKRNHDKTDRLLEVALKNKLPTIIFAEGGGGRPGDVDFPTVAGLYVPSFAAFAKLSGIVPLVGIVSGRCFAGNAALLGCSDVIISTKYANIGMAGPAMIEGGGLGVFTAEQVGPASIQHQNGVIDILVDDEEQAVTVAKQYLSYFQGDVTTWEAPDPYALRGVVPENRLRVYDTRKAIEGIVDKGSMLALRTGFGVGIHTYLARIEGRAVGILANNTYHLGGAIDATAADKASRFMQLCNVHGIPLIALVDTPGFMVGPDVETQAQVRHVSRMFVTGAKIRVPYLAVALRKGYGLGAMAMVGGGFRAPSFMVSWPTGEFGGMGLEGAVRLGFKKELEALEGDEREALYQRLVGEMYEKGSAINAAAGLEIDAVIDPAETRSWLLAGLDAGLNNDNAPIVPFIDTW